jgi:hypothetical protein
MALYQSYPTSLPIIGDEENLYAATINPDQKPNLHSRD